MNDQCCCQGTTDLLNLILDFYRGSGEPPDDAELPVYERFSMELAAKVAEFTNMAVVLPSFETAPLGEFGPAAGSPNFSAIAPAVAMIVTSDASASDLKQLKLDPSGNLCATATLQGTGLKHRYLDFQGTAFLVSENVVATAKHLLDRNEISSYFFIFGYLDSKGFADVDIAQAEQIVGSGYSDDWSLVCLKDSVGDRAPLRVSNGDRLPSPQTELYSLGHPFGLPLLASGPSVSPTALGGKLNLPGILAYQGASGSPVFNHNTGIVEGIVTNGQSKLLPPPDGAFACLEWEVNQMIGVLGRGTEGVASWLFESLVPPPGMRLQKANNEGDSLAEGRPESRFEIAYPFSTPKRSPNPASGDVWIDNFCPDSDEEAAESSEVSG